MNTTAKTIASITFQAIWQVSRYALATGITALALAIVPLTLVLVLTIMVALGEAKHVK